MKKILLFSLALLFCTSLIYGQCNLDFGSSAGQFPFATQSGSDIVNATSSGANDFSTQSFNIWDEANGDCTTSGGLDDITFDFEMVHAFDQYNVDGIIDAFAGSTHDITQSTSGLRGNIPLGNSSTNESSTGDVRGYKITITFASHIEVLAGDVIVNLTSVNTAGEAHESSSLVFLDGSGSPYGTTTYDGYYMGTTGASTDGSCTTPGVRTNSWSTSGTGVYTASSTVNTTIVDPCNPLAGIDGSTNNGDVNAVTDTGLSATDPIGGLVFTVYLEDVAASSAPGAETSTRTAFTSTINGIEIASSPLPVELLAFNAAPVKEGVLLHWLTASEINNDFFDIQWSADGLRFESIGSEIGQGNSIQVNDYTFMHTTPKSGNNYYRLKQVDFNGNFTYSEIKIVELKLDREILVYPTIVDAHVTISKPEQKSQILIYDLNASLVQEIHDRADQQVQLNLESLPSGTYFIRIITDELVHTEKIIKQ